ncbi:aminodeoxychorismate synthase component I [Hoylesella enoeca]|uniref:Para-aminobenzoate synthase n=1 Tax=Hoylesella enoeca TaxID=76123 RepID=A0A0S2KJA6_9BACT|nr:aminodeoxychorismate synthase component I [Hoylesella enoeca]ALO48395.1 para-aminobenzoate synthase [Hoylesella enoeca]
MKAYDRERAIHRIDELAAANRPFIFVVSYDTETAFVEEVDAIDARECLFAFPGRDNIPADATFAEQPVIWKADLPTQQSYARQLQIVQNHLQAGNSYLVNLTCRVPVETNVSMRDIFLRAHAPYRLWIKDRLVCFSPETFVRVNRYSISSFPMKGTIDATIPNAAKVLYDNAKEAAEHATIVDLIRNDLSIVADHVHVSRYRYVEQLTTNRGAILQTSSEINGQLTDYYHHHLGQMLYTQLPAGSITGAPKLKTMSIIAQAEDYQRGFYSGVMGYYARGRMDSAVMIRFIDTENGHLYYKAGGGITAKSICQDEYQEVIEKIYVPIY